MQKQKMEAFINRLYKQQNQKTLTKEEITSQVKKACFTPDLRAFLKGLPMKRFNREESKADLNSTIKNDAKDQAARKKNIRTKEIGSKKWSKDYRKSDMQALFSRGRWQNWDEAIQWLEENAESDNEITPGEATAMKEDFSKLKSKGTSFPQDAKTAYMLAHRNRR